MMLPELLLDCASEKDVGYFYEKDTKHNYFSQCFHRSLSVLLLAKSVRNNKMTAEIN